MIFRKKMHVRAYSGIHKGKTGRIEEIFLPRASHHPNRAKVLWDDDQTSSFVRLTDLMPGKGQ